MKLSKIQKYLYLSFVILLGTLESANARTVEMEGHAQDYSFIGCHGDGRDERIVQLAIDDASKKMNEVRPDCFGPTLLDYKIVEEERINKCTWIEEYRVVVKASYFCSAW